MLRRNKRIVLLAGRCGNTAMFPFPGGYFRNVVDRTYPQYQVTENEFEVCNDDSVTPFPAETWAW